MRMPVWFRGTLLLAVTFIAGVLIGAGVERRRTPALDAAGMSALHVMHRLRDGLELDSAQQQEIAAILGHHQRAVDATWHSMRPHMRASLDSALEEIVSVLRPDQMERYRELVETVHHEGPLP